jgi:alcohol dehydrogenase (cytochrome c)
MRFQHVSYLTFWLSLPIALFAAQGVHAQGVHVESKPYATVTDERLQHPEAGDWLMYRRTYDGSGFSPLRQITTRNIGKLSLAWSLNTDLIGAHETTPIVNRGQMFITTPGNNVIALDAKTGTQLWRYVKKYPEGLFQLHPTNRGVALYGDRVYMALAATRMNPPSATQTNPVKLFRLA